VLYVADAELTPFSRKAIRQADQLILVGDHSVGDAKLNALEIFAFDIHSPAARRLVLLHDVRGPTPGTAPWLDLRPASLHHHVVTGEQADYDRLAASSRATPSALSQAEAERCAPRISVSTARSPTLD
jgi:NTE family protein